MQTTKITLNEKTYYLTVCSDGGCIVTNAGRDRILGEFKSERLAYEWLDRNSRKEDNNGRMQEL